MSSSEKLLDVQDLKTHFFTREGVVRAVDGISFNIAKEEALGLVGESGSGKSVTALSILRLIGEPGRIMQGRICFEGEDLLKKTDEEMRAVRGRKISMVFQDPTSSLNPVINVGEQIAETIRKHRDLTNKEAWKEAVGLMEILEIPNAKERAIQYPFQFSGGMRQRIMLAIALSCNPRLLILDEPTTNLDVTVQAQMMETIGNLRDTFESSILLITHNLGLIAWLCDHVAVMYAGGIVESGMTQQLFDTPKHPYTAALLASVPRLDEDRERLATIKGRVPSLVDVPSGCAFHPRCPCATIECRANRPELLEVAPGHMVRCFQFG